MKKKSYNPVITALFSVVIAILLYWLTGKVSVSSNPLVEAIRTIILSVEVAIILGIISNEFYFKSTKKVIAETCKASISTLEKGLAEVKYFSEINFKELIENSSEIIIITQYSIRAIYDNYTSEIRDFIGKSKNKLTIVLLDKDATNLISVLKNKFEKSGEAVDIPGRIDESIQKLKSLKTKASKKKRLFIRKTELVPVYCLYMFDNTIILGPYFYAPDRSSKVPAYILKNTGTGCLYSDYKNDILKLLDNSNSEIVYEA